MQINKVMMLFIIYLFILFQNSNVSAEVTRWPVPDWETADNSSKMLSPQCQKFKEVSLNSKDVKTDGLLVIKDGLVQFEFYDSKNSINKPHALWSVTKTITAALLGIAERDGRINLDQKLYEYYPIIKKDTIYNNNYKKISIKNLLYLDAGFIWNEASQDVSANPVIGMLYGTGHRDMATFAAKIKMIKKGPSYKWNYSTGIPTITMGVLKKIYGNESYEELPWRNLFNPLGITTAIFERDSSGTFIGGAGSFATLRDLAKIGYLYLNGGQWNGEVILTPEWIQKMLTPSPGYVSPGTVITDISDEGVYGGSIWLNRKIKDGFGKPYPYSPEDMYLAVGLLGQLIIMLPTQKMIIVRTGYGFGFNSKIDKFVSSAISCFHDPKYPLGKEIPPLKNPPKLGLGKIIMNVKNSVEANTLQGSIAKTVCSCHLVSGLDIPTCLERNDFTLSKLLTKLEVKKNVAFDGKIGIQVKLARFARLFKLHYGNSALAYYDPNHAEYGCTLR
ncbi:MAG: serine hydrolase [Bacteriovorax sp.]|nr:serine hydrolase [Bacteriovorax sp.]